MMASFALRCTWVMMGLLLLSADNFGSVHGLRTRQYHIHNLHADDSMPSNHVVTSGMDGMSQIRYEMERDLNTGRNLLQRPTPKNIPGTPSIPREPPNK